MSKRLRLLIVEDSPDDAELIVQELRHVGDAPTARRVDTEDQLRAALRSEPWDVVICDWHYERPDKTAVYFAMKGLRVVTCPWRVSASGVAQVNDMVNFRGTSTPEMKSRFLGIVETTWSPTRNFLNGYYGVGQKGTAR